MINNAFISQSGNKTVQFYFPGGIIIDYFDVDMQGNASSIGVGVFQAELAMSTTQLAWTGAKIAMNSSTLGAWSIGNGDINVAGGVVSYHAFSGPNLQLFVPPLAQIELRTVQTGGASWINLRIGWHAAGSDPNPSHVTQVTKQDLQQIYEDVAGFIDVIPHDLSPPFDFTPEKTDLQFLNSFVLTGRQALEAAFEVVEAALNGLQTIVTHQYYWLSALDLLIQNAEMTASQAFDLFASWTTGGLSSVTSQLGVIGKGQQDQYPDTLKEDLTPLNNTLVKVAREAIGSRALPQNSKRVRLTSNHQKRIGKG